MQNTGKCTNIRDIHYCWEINDGIREYRSDRKKEYYGKEDAIEFQ